MALPLFPPLPRVPRLCFWELTHACNLRCIHCEADAGRPAPDELTAEEALTLASELGEVGCREVQLTGGEPLLRPDWAIIAARLAELGMKVTVITNGTLVDAPMVERMVRAGVQGLSCSLDGQREVHDAIRVRPGGNGPSSYDSVERALRLAVDSPLRTAVITQIHQGNLDDLGAIHEKLVMLGVDVWQVQICMPLGRLLRFKDQYLLRPEQLPSLEEKLAAFIRDGRLRIAVGDNIGYYGRAEPILRGSVKGKQSFWMGCIAGCGVVALCPNGDVKGCPSHPREFVVGNVRQTPFARIWQDAERFPYTTAWNEELLEGGCRSCPYRRLCRAGCTTMAYAVTGTIYDNPYCLQRVRSS
jgi:radical SAM protein with 4Fe4S-binding SPASM domain